MHFPAARFALALRAVGRRAVLKVLTGAPAFDVSCALESAGLGPAEYSVEFVRPADTARALSGSARIGVVLRSPNPADVELAVVRLLERLDGNNVQRRCGNAG